MIFDTHCHLNHEDFIDNTKEVIDAAFNNGVDAFLIPGWDYESSKAAIKLSNEFDNCYAAIGIHPSDVKRYHDSIISDLKKLSLDKRVVAIGEIGLDFYWDKEEESKQKQREFFIKQINLANELNLPIVVHSRDATLETFNIIKNNPVNKKGIIHCFSGSVETMKEYIKLGYMIGIGGIVTFKNANEILKVVSECTIENIVVETDSPYLAPHPYRGKENKPEYITLVIDKIAELKNMDKNEVIKITNENGRRVFGI